MNADQPCYIGWRERWPKIIVHCQSDAAIDTLQRYYSEDGSGRPRYTGARFEAMASLNDDPHTVGPADFVAVSMLSVSVPPEAAIRLLGPDAATVSSLLKQIPQNQDIVDIDPDLLATESPAGKLWRALRGGNDGIGRTTASKLLAAKRPRLMPIWDSFVAQATGLDTPDYWRRFQQVLIADDRRMWIWLGELRSQAQNVPVTVSELRVLDVLLWMSVESGPKRFGQGSI